MLASEGGHAEEATKIKESWLHFQRQQSALSLSGKLMLKAIAAI